MTIVIYDIINIMLVVYKGNMLPFSKYRRDLLYHIDLIYDVFPHQKRNDNMVLGQQAAVVLVREKNGKYQAVRVRQQSLVLAYW